jgi:spore germination protein PF
MQMPSIIGAFKVVTNTGTINNGDLMIISPTTQSTKIYKGSGTDVTGDYTMTISIFSATITYGSDQFKDSPIKAKGELSKYRRKVSVRKQPCLAHNKKDGGH